MSSSVSFGGPASDAASTPRGGEARLGALAVAGRHLGGGRQVECNWRVVKLR